MVPNLLKENHLIGIYTEGIAERLARDFDLVARPLSPEVEPLDQYMVWHRRYESDPRHRWFREQMVLARADRPDSTENAGFSVYAAGLRSREPINATVICCDGRYHIG